MSYEFGAGAFGASTLLRAGATRLPEPTVELFEFGARAGSSAASAFEQVSAAFDFAALRQAPSGSEAFDLASLLQTGTARRFASAELASAQPQGGASQAEGAAPVSYSQDFQAWAASLDSDIVLRCACSACIKSAEKEMASRQAGDSDARAGDFGTAAMDPVPDVPHDDENYTLSTADPGRPIRAEIENGADRDLFKVELKAGQVYEFFLDLDDNTGDLVLELTDQFGVPLVRNEEPVQADSGGPGEDEMLSFEATEDGTYYVSVRPFDAGTGGYAISAQVSELPVGGSLVPTDAIDWGGTDNRVDTDGVKNAQGDDVIHYYFSKAGEAYMTPLGPQASVGWKDYEMANARVAMQQYENIINVDYVEVFTKEEADFVLVAGEQAPAILGRMSAPGEPYEGQGEFNTLGVGWDEQGLKQGGYGYVTFIHEFGHGMGLAHPHDTGGGSTIMRGVSSDGDAGDFELNQGVYTTMSYRSGYPDGPQGGSDSNNYGYEGTLMAFDVAVLQAKYGANMDYNKGNNVYTLPDANESGSFYACLWDTGGVDTIRTGSDLNSYIDLRAATLKYEPGGGGWVSYAEGIHGGFTIANGVVIEKASGGGGDDELIGNAARNVLHGRDGDDLLSGGLGGDTLYGGSGLDTADLLDSAIGANINRLTGSHTGASAGDKYYGIEQFLLTNHADSFRGGAGGETVYGYYGADSLYGNGGNDFLGGGAGGDALYGGDGFDTATYRLASSAVSINRATGVQTNSAAGDTYSSIEAFDLTHFADTYVGVTGFEYVNGLGGNDTLNGARGDDVLVGGGGADALTGGLGIDTASYRFEAAGATINLATGANTGSANGDTLTSLERFLLTDFNDSFTGGSAAETVYGYSGNDTLVGGAGGDWMMGGAGQDSLTGGDGRDRFVFKSVNESLAASADTINDLTDVGPAVLEADIIDLGAIDANGSGAGNGTFMRVAGDGAFTAAGQLRLVLDELGLNTRLELNTDGDAAAEAVIILTGVHNQQGVEDGWVL